MPRLLTEELLPYQEIADGPPEQQYEFALRWRDGQGLPKSREGYLNWVRRSALGGFPPALYEFGLARLAGEIGVIGAFDGADWIWAEARRGPTICRRSWTWRGASRAGMVLNHPPFRRWLGISSPSATVRRCPSR